MSHSAEFNRNAALVASGVLMGFVGAMGGNTQAASDTELLYADAQGAETCVQNLEDYAERRSRHHLSLARAACGDAVVLRVRFKDDPSNTALFDMGIDSDGELQGIARPLATAREASQTARRDRRQADKLRAHDINWGMYSTVAAWTAFVGVISLAGYVRDRRLSRQR